MDLFGLSFWSFFWFFIPLPLLAVWATITFFTERKYEDS